MSNIPEKIYTHGCQIEYTRSDLIPQWQPIETAPKDGTEILLYTDHCQMLQGYWSSDNKEWTLVFYAETKKEGRDTPIDSFSLNPTHWMPLPEFKEAVGG